MVVVGMVTHLRDFNALNCLIYIRSGIKSGEALHPASPVQSLPKAVANMPEVPEPVYVNLIKSTF